MKCEVIQDLLSCYIDNTCSEETRKLVDEHLETCDECKALYKELTHVEYDIQPVINEKKAFVKVKQDLLKKVLLVICIFAVLFLFCGSRITGTIVKERINAYVENKYSDLNLEMTSFSYRDPEAEGFGINNAYYVAEFSDPNQKDMTFAVYTEGFFLKIVDNYDYQINQRYSTVWRLVEEYSYDVQMILNKELGELFMDCSTGLDDETGYDYTLLDLNHQYSRSVDQLIPISLHITLYVPDDTTTKEDIVKNVVSILKENGFNTPCLSITFIYENGQVYNNFDEIHNLEY